MTQNVQNVTTLGAISSCSTLPDVKNNYLDRLARASLVGLDV